MSQFFTEVNVRLNFTGVKKEDVAEQISWETG